MPSNHSLMLSTHVLILQELNAWLYGGIDPNSGTAVLMLGTHVLIFQVVSTMLGCTVV